MAAWGLSRQGRAGEDSARQGWHTKCVGCDGLIIIIIACVAAKGDLEPSLYLHLTQAGHAVRPQPEMQLQAEKGSGVLLLLLGACDAVDFVSLK